MMTRRQLTDSITLGLFLVAALLAGIAAAGVEETHEIRIVVDSGDGTPVVSARLDSDELGYDPFSLTEGENRAIALDDGRTALLTRTADGLTITVDDEEIAIPAPPPVPEPGLDIGADPKAGSRDVDVEVSDSGERRVVIRQERRIERTE